MRLQRLAHVGEVADRQVDGERRATRPQPLELLAGRHRARLHGGARGDHGLRDLRQGQLASERGGGGDEGGHAGRHVVGDGEGIQPPHLLGGGAVDGRIARVDPRHVVPARVRLGHQGGDLVEVHGRGVAHQRALRRGGDHLRRHERSGVEAHRAALDQAQPAHGNEVGRARAGADEVNGHAASFPLSDPLPDAMPVPSLAP